MNHGPTSSALLVHTNSRNNKCRWHSPASIDSGLRLLRLSVIMFPLLLKQRAVDADANSPSCASILLYIPLHTILNQMKHEQRVDSVQLNVKEALIQFTFT